MAQKQTFVTESHVGFFEFIEFESLIMRHTYHHSNVMLDKILEHLNTNLCKNITESMLQVMKELEIQNATWVVENCIIEGILSPFKRRVCKKIRESLDLIWMETSIFVGFYKIETWKRLQDDLINNFMDHGSWIKSHNYIHLTMVYVQIIIYTLMWCQDPYLRYQLH